VKADRVSLALASPHLPIVGGGILSALVTFLPIAVLYLGASPRQAFTLFAALYTISIPPLAASAYTLYRLSSLLSRQCGGPQFPRSVFVGVLLPLGYVPALQALLIQLFQCTRFKGAARPSPADVLWNLLTAGAYSAAYAALVSRMVDLVLQSSGLEE
jgi:hypothetical protein